MRMLICSDPAILDSLHGCGCRGSPGRGLRLCLRLSWLLLRLEWRQYIVGRCWCVCLLLCQSAGQCPVYVWIGWVLAVECIPDGRQLIAHELVLFLNASTVLSLGSQACVLSPCDVVCPGEILDILDS